MGDVLRAVGSLFGFGGDDPPAQEVKTPIDPVAERQALAELNGAASIEQSEVKPPADPRMVSPTIDKDGTVNFDLLFSQAGFTDTEFSADHAVKLVANVEKTIPAVITDPSERSNFLKNVILATMDSASTPSSIVNDARKKSDILTTLVRTRLDMAVDLKQRASDKIKSLERQIAAAHDAIDTADSQFAAISKNCKERQTLYARIIDLLGPLPKE